MVCSQIAGESIPPVAYQALAGFSVPFGRMPARCPAPQGSSPLCRSVPAARAQAVPKVQDFMLYYLISEISRGMGEADEGNRTSEHGNYFHQNYEYNEDEEREHVTKERKIRHNFQRVF